MNKLSKIILPAILVIIAAVVLQTFSVNQDGAPFTANNTTERGASLLFDTLAHMGYPVRVGRRPVNMTGYANRAYIFIQPNLAHFNEEKTADLLAWVAAGGQLFFLHNNPSTPIDAAISTGGTSFGSLTIHEIGQGVLVRGRAEDIVNIHLMNQPDTGAGIEAVLSQRWETISRVYFAQFYQHPPAAETFFNRLPFIIRLAVIQLALIALIIVWYLGKRFGNPIAYYQEQEREENEHVRALAQLYMKTRRKSR